MNFTGAKKSGISKYLKSPSISSIRYNCGNWQTSIEFHVNQDWSDLCTQCSSLIDKESRQRVLSRGCPPNHRVVPVTVSKNLQPS